MNHGRSNPPDNTQEHENGICLQTDIPPNPLGFGGLFPYHRHRALFALLLVVALFYFVARLVFALAWRLFVGFVFVLIIILLIL
ncbi:hypothetical protein NXW76_20610 [Bacteroides thetaiotaomicron]|nr:hypothetical protein [Bacteroides thetaiotaomicron]